MTDKEQKEQILQALEEFKVAWSKCNDIFMSVNIDDGLLNDIIAGPDYPFELSFDEQYLKVLEWIADSKKRAE